MNYNKLYYFYRISQTMNLTRAAEQLYVSQSSLSKAMRDLETELGVELFIRANRAISLTEAGEVLYEECAKFFDRTETIVRRVQQAAEQPFAKIHFGYMMYGVIYHIPSIIQSFLQAYPDVRVETKPYQGRNQLTADLLQNTIDVGLKLYAAEEELPDQAHLVLEERPLSLVVYEGHPLAKRKLVSLSDLQNEAFIMMGTGENSAEYKHTLGWCQRCGFTPRIIAAFDQVETVMMMVQSGAGIALLSDYAPVSMMTGLKNIYIRNAPTLCSAIVWNEGQLSDAGRSFVRHLAKAIQEKNDADR